MQLVNVLSPVMSTEIKKAHSEYIQCRRSAYFMLDRLDTIRLINGYGFSLVEISTNST